MIGENIKRIREDRGLTQGQLADLLGVSDGAVSAWEVNRNSPGLRHLDSLATALNCTRDDLLDEKLDEIPEYPPFQDLISGKTKDTSVNSAKTVFEKPPHLSGFSSPAARRKQRQEMMQQTINQRAAESMSSTDRFGRVTLALAAAPELVVAVEKLLQLPKAEQRNVIALIQSLAQGVKQNV